jgi:cell division protein ZapE
MLEVQGGIAEQRRGKGNGRSKDDPIAVVASALAAKIDLLCFDEFAVYDIADAMILGRLFEQLFQRGVVIVATSNVAPDDLYKDGLNRALFLPFIALLKTQLTVFHLDAPRDYRLGGEGTDRRYATPLGVEAEACLSAQFRRLSGVERGWSAELTLKGRTLIVPEAADGVARFSFDDLCSRPLGSGDYLRIAEAYPTIVLSDVPVLHQSRRNEAKRFIKLIDIFYDKHVRLIVSAAAEPNELYDGTEGAEGFEFARTTSRLIEMRSDAYWSAASDDAKKKEARAVAPGPLE